MSKESFAQICALIAQRKVRASAHAYTRCSKRSILVSEVVQCTPSGEVIESYPNYHVGHAVLVLLLDRDNRPIHAVWGLEKGTTEPAVLVTAYRPSPDEWSDDFRTRRQ